MTWVPGKSHLIADALSRAPLFAPEETEDIVIDTARICLAKFASGQLDIILDAIDADYTKLRSDVKNGSFHSIYAKQLKSVMPQLSVGKDLVYFDGSRIVLPLQATKKILSLLHVSHIGLNKTYNLCRSMCFCRGCLTILNKWCLNVAPATFIALLSRRTLGPVSLLFIFWASHVSCGP